MKKETAVMAQKHLLQGVEWASEDPAVRARMTFKTKNGGKVSGGFTPDGSEPGAGLYWIWFVFNDEQGERQEEKFRPFWIPQDCRHCAQQAYMRLNEILGRDVWTDLAPIRKEHGHRVLPGRLPERD